MFPSVKDFKISEERKKYIIGELLSKFERAAVARKMVNLREASPEEKLLTLGFNHIVDRIWFVDYVGGDTGYSYHTLGGTEGEGLALSENNLILKTIMDKSTNENEIKVETPISEVALDTAISFLENKGFDCESIVTNVHEVFAFWWFKNFKGLSRSDPRVLIRNDGFYKAIPIYWQNSIPENTTMLINKNVGELLIGKQMTADILDIKEAEFDSILRNIPSLREADLHEKVRFTASETLRFDFKNKNAFAILKTNGSFVFPK